MAKYMVLFKSSMSAAEQMAKATPEQMKASMAEWIKWKDDLDKSMSFDWGMPLKPLSEITNNEMTGSQSSVSGYGVMEGEEAEISKVLKSHPHLNHNGTSIELLEILSIPGM